MYDVDNFKQINETLGHVSADEILVKLAQALRESFRDADTIARYGGDELIILAHVNSVDEATAIAERSLAHVLDTVGVSLSAGVAVYPITSRTLEAAVQEADAALGRAKHSGKARAVAAESPAA
jgi:diguanylate cyclase (GGDEF)-like protein